MNVTNLTPNLMPAVNVTSGFNTVDNVFMPLFMVGVAVALMALLLYASSSIAKYTRVKRVLKRLAHTFNYAAYGALTVIIIAVPCYLAYTGLTVAADNPEASIEIGKYILIGAGIYTGLTLLGYITKKRVWKRLAFFRSETRTYKENIEKLPKGGELLK